MSEYSKREKFKPQEPKSSVLRKEHNTLLCDSSDIMSQSFPNTNQLNLSDQQKSDRRDKQTVQDDHSADGSIDNQ